MGPSSTSATDHTFFSNSSSSTSGSSTVITTRFVPYVYPQDPRAGAPSIKVTAHEVPPPTSAPNADALPKRKGGELLTRRAPKKRRVSPADDVWSTSQSRASSVRSSPIPSGSSSRTSSSRTTSSPGRLFSRSTRAASAPSTRAASVAVPDPPPGPPRECWINEHGHPGPDFLSSEAVVRNLMKGYIAYFNNPMDPDDKSFEPHPTDYPVVELEFPNTNASERFILLAPKDKDHYNPIMCLESSLHTIVEHYLTPAQRSLFGTLPPKDSELMCGDEDSDDERSLSPPSDAPSPPSSRVSTPSSVSSASSLSSSYSLFSKFSSCSISSPSSLCSVSSLSSYAKPSSPMSEPTVDFLRLLRRAIRTKDGPFFLKVMSAINALLSLLKYPPVSLDPFVPPPANVFRDVVRTWERMPSQIAQRIVDECYQRAVGPNVDMLRRYEAFSSEVYGELMPNFVSEIFRATGLRKDSLFLDLGSGVGNVALQAGLEIGCRSFGIELMPGPAGVARSLQEQFRIRCRMWGVRMGEVELEEGDMLKSPRVDALVKEADVVLVNNKVFLEPLNEALRQKFLDLKEGAIVVSLKCLMGSGRSAARERSSSPALKERNLDDISEIFTVTSRSYSPGSVSWGGGGGEYFLQRMNREDYARRKLQFETSRAGSARVTRSRR